MLRNIVRKALCALWDHPPVVHLRGGQMNCARCGENVGHAILLDYPLDDLVATKHIDCKPCVRVMKTLTWKDKLLTEFVDPNNSKLKP